MNTWIRQMPRCVHRWIGLALFAVPASLISLGCATTPAPTDQVAVSTEAIVRAEREGAPELAAAEMGIAREKLLRVNTAMAARAYRRALWLAQEAQLDAELAEVKAKSTKTTSAAVAVKQGTQQMRDELAGKTHGR